ncbi:hypothetical protein HELRODRAFT_189346 [Helobdella robusta]|uniref:Uncharacterized protein n=1 Tax=Helobdella robusta TaxID=6412 RepID=T1FQZ6_HELRO|nr:hypothetical protein HELRODRAFT_189346 [Helobdella robusta]ESN96722.1 hypothetical protein HELRODRAFT_189346 [Helobdella robusta]
MMETKTLALKLIVYLLLRDVQSATPDHGTTQLSRSNSNGDISPETHTDYDNRSYLGNHNSLKSKLFNKYHEREFVPHILMTTRAKRIGSPFTCLFCSGHTTICDPTIACYPHTIDQFVRSVGHPMKTHKQVKLKKQQPKRYAIIVEGLDHAPKYAPPIHQKNNIRFP